MPTKKKSADQEVLADATVTPARRAQLAATRAAQGSDAPKTQLQAEGERQQEIIEEAWPVATPENPVATNLDEDVEQEVFTTVKAEKPAAKRVTLKGEDK